MSFPVAPGSPQYAGTFIPEIWSKKLRVKFYDATVLAAISNTDYEGEIKAQGDTINIRKTPDIVIRNYAKGQNLQIQRPESPIVTLTIDKGKYFNCICDDVDKIQSDLKLLDDWSDDAGEQMKIAVDTDILHDIYDDMDAHNKGNTAGEKSGSVALGVTGTGVSLTKTNVLDYIVDCGTVLDEQNVPEQNRWFIIPPWVAGMIKKSDLKDASLTGDGKSVLRNGRLGMIDRFTLYSSNLLKTASDTGTYYYTLFGHKSALTFAAQMTNVETLRSESTFGDLVRGLNVYGYKVVGPTAMGTLYCKKG